MTKSNEALRAEIDRVGAKYYEIADLMGISPYTFSVWLRKPLDEAKTSMVKKALQKIEGVTNY